MDILTKENSKILRGLAITAIVLHNFLHIDLFGLSSENEMSFSVEKFMAFFSSLDDGLLVAQIFSFLGWVGVPVFVFLTGYGSASLTPHILQGIIYLYKEELP